MIDVVQSRDQFFNNLYSRRKINVYQNGKRSCKYDDLSRD